MIIMLLISLGCGLLCSHIALRKNLNAKLHSILGVVFGPLGLLYSVLIPSKKVSAF